MKMIRLKKYRLVTDRDLGYECQVWRWWFPFWVEMWESWSVRDNTHASIEEAEDFIKYKKKFVKTVTRK